jgi:carbon-monoxide dehydrogenase medium subunit
MFPNTFEYTKANTVDEALAALNGEAKFLAGGQSLLAAMKLRLNNPEKLVDITKIAELKGIKEQGNEIVIGAGTTHNEIVKSSLIQSKLPILAQAGGLIGDIQVRNVGTLGGSLAHADPAADWPASLLACEATIVVKGSGGSRSIKAADFFTGLFATALQEGELITEVRVPIPASGTVDAYMKFMQPASRFAIVGCAVVLTKNGSTIQNARIGFTGVSEFAFRDSAVENALNGQTLNEATIQAAAQKAVEGVSILSDHFASEEYRKHLAKVYCKRTLMSLI